MKGQGGGGTAKGGGKNRVGGGSVAVKKTKARQTAAIDANVMALREALFKENGKDKDVTEGLAKSFLEYKINDAPYSISFATHLSDDDLDWAFEITKEHMFAIYDSSGFGWDDDDKMEELTEKGARFLVVRDAQRNIQAFVHFRFTVQGEVLDQMAGDICLYIMDIQLSSEVQRKGLGKHLLVVLELIGRREKMTRVSLPVFNGDNRTVAWLAKTGRGFVNDESYADLGFDSGVEGFRVFSKIFPVAVKPAAAPVIPTTVFQLPSVPTTTATPAPSSSSAFSVEGPASLPSPTKSVEEGDWVVVNAAMEDLKMADGSK